MDCGIDAHWHCVGILAGDPFVHVEQVAIAFANDVLAEAPDRVGEIQVDAESAFSYSSTFIAYELRIARCDVAWDKISETRIFPLKVVITLVFRNLVRAPSIVFLLRNPDPPVV